MRLGWLLLLMLSFPVVEAVGIFWVAREIGAWVLLWLAAAALAGVALIRFERAAWGARLLFSMQAGTHPVSALFASGRVLLAGGLLVFPGFVSDAIALVLLLMPGTWNRPRVRAPQAANEAWPPREPSPRTDADARTLDGEFRREDDDRLR